MKAMTYACVFALGIVLTASGANAQDRRQTENQNPLGSETLEDTARTGGVHPPGTPGIEISNPTTYGDNPSTLPLFTAEAGSENFKGNWPLVGLVGLLGLWGYWRKPQEIDD